MSVGVEWPSWRCTYNTDSPWAINAPSIHHRPGVPLFDLVAAGCTGRDPRILFSWYAAELRGVQHVPDVDMSGGSSDDAVLAIGYRDPDGRVIVSRVLSQGPPPPFDPRLAVTRFAEVLREYGITKVRGDRYAGETFRADFRNIGIEYEVCEQTTSQLYEALEPILNGGRVVLPDLPVMEQQLGLIANSVSVIAPGAGPVFLAQGHEDDAEPHRTQAQPKHGLIGGNRWVSVQFGEPRQNQSADLLIDGATEPEEEVEDPHGGGDDL